MFVYFIKCQDDNGFIKIGVAKDTKSRLDTLQTGCPYPLKIISAIKCRDRMHAYSIEKSIHKFFSYARIGGEWFRGDIKINDLSQDIISGNGLINMGVERNSPRKLYEFRRKEIELKEHEAEKELDSMCIDDIYKML